MSVIKEIQQGEQVINAVNQQGTKHYLNNGLFV